MPAGQPENKNQNKPHTLLIVEDDINTSIRFKKILESTHKYNVTIVGNVSDSIQSLDKNFDIILVDISLPDGNGISIINFAKSLNLSSRIMVVTSAKDEKTILNAIDAGADGYIIKTTSPRELLNAVSELINGNSPISAHAAKYILKRSYRLNSKSKDGLSSKENKPNLTPREIDVLWGISKGLSYSNIAESLNISSNTVPGHIKSIYKKLNVHTRGEAVFEAIYLGLINFEK